MERRPEYRKKKGSKKPKRSKSTSGKRPKLNILRKGGSHLKGGDAKTQAGLGGTVPTMPVTGKESRKRGLKIEGKVGELNIKTLRGLLHKGLKGRTPTSQRGFLDFRGLL